MTPPHKLKAVFDRIDSMSIRERILVAGTTLAVVWAVWDALFMQPLQALEQARQNQVESLSSQVADLNRSIQLMATGQPSDAESARRLELESLREEIATLEQRVGERTANLVAPGEMASVLGALLERSSDLEFVGVAALPPQPVGGVAGSPPIYRHGVTLRVRGNYLDALRYLQAIERLQWRFFWDSVEVVVDQHPVSDIRITVFTLGEGEAVIGV